MFKRVQVRHILQQVIQYFCAYKSILMARVNLLLVFVAQQTFSNSKEVDHLGDTEQWSNNHHSAQTSLEESGDSFVFECFSKKIIVL